MFLYFSFNFKVFNFLKTLFSMPHKFILEILVLMSEYLSYFHFFIRFQILWQYCQLSYIFNSESWIALTSLILFRVWFPFGRWANYFPESWTFVGKQVIGSFQRSLNFNWRFFIDTFSNTLYKCSTSAWNETSNFFNFTPSTLKNFLSMW